MVLRGMHHFILGYGVDESTRRSCRCLKAVKSYQNSLPIAYCNSDVDGPRDAAKNSKQNHSALSNGTIASVVRG